MADNAQRSEKPTAKRLRDARRKGQIPRSPDLVGWATLLAASFVLPTLAAVVHRTMAGYLQQATRTVAAGDPGQAMVLAAGMAGDALGWTIVFLAVMFAATAAGMAVQGGVTLTAQPLKPKWERLSPKAGVKRLVSAQSLVDTGKALFRLTVMAVLVLQVGVGYISSLLSGTSRALEPAGVELADALLLVVRLVAVVGVVVGLGDYAFQRYRTGKQLRMTKHEVKQESRNTEGDPLTRGRRRRAHADITRNQMLAAVNEASVVVVNPTHVAVALAYEAGGVPTVVAKGDDDLALRIRERAFEKGIPVVEVRPLARVLHDLIDVGEEVPAHLYEAVAIVIAFVMRAPATTLERAVRTVSVPPSKLLNTRVLDDPSTPALPQPRDPATDRPTKTQPDRPSR